MNPRHRIVCITVLFAALVVGWATFAGEPPKPDQLQTGDLIWPKPPSAMVPYNSRPGEADSNDAARWQKDKDKYLEQLRLKPHRSQSDVTRYSELHDMTYKQFLARYLDDVQPGQVMPYGTGFVFTGHVGIIQFVDNTPTVVEAMDDDAKGVHKVQRVPYATWVDVRKGNVFWVGRLKNVSAEERAAVAAAAASYLEKPYDFWNFNLSDDTAFYCSKLAWLSIVKAAHFPPDDNPNPDRALWFSPKQLMRSKHIELVVNPGDYGPPLPSAQ